MCILFTTFNNCPFISRTRILSNVLCVSYKYRLKITYCLKMINRSIRTRPENTKTSNIVQQKTIVNFTIIDVTLKEKS